MANTLGLRSYYNPGAGTAWTDVGATEILWFQASGAFAYGVTGAIQVGAYNGGFHIISAAHAELCAAGHPVNVKYVSGTECDIGGGTINVNTIAITDCLNLHATCSPNAQVTAAGFFVYGATEPDAPSGFTCYGVKQGDANWADVGGSAAEYDLGTSGSAATHDMYFALSVTPTSNGAKTATLKGSMTFV